MTQVILAQGGLWGCGRCRVGGCCVLRSRRIGGWWRSGVLVCLTEKPDHPDDGGYAQYPLPRGGASRWLRGRLIGLLLGRLRSGLSILGAGCAFRTRRGARASSVLLCRRRQCRVHLGHERRKTGKAFALSLFLLFFSRGHRSLPQMNPIRRLVSPPSRSRAGVVRKASSRLA